MKRKFLFALLLAVILLAVSLLLWQFVPGSTASQLSAVCRISAESTYALPLGPKDTLYLSVPDDSVHVAAFRADDVAHSEEQSGAFVSDEGHVVTTDKLMGCAPDTLPAHATRQRLEAADSVLERQLKRMRQELAALDEYAEMHSVADDGYNEVMDFREQTLQQFRQTDSLHQCLHQALEHTLAPALLHATVRVWTNDTTAYPAAVVRRRDGLLLLRLSHGALPREAARFSVYRFGAYAYKAKLFALNDYGGLTRSVQAEKLERGATLFPCSEGGVWVNPSGNLCGVQQGGQRTGSGEVARLLAEESTWPVWWWRNGKALIRRLTDDASEHTPGTHIPNPADARRDGLRCVRRQLSDSCMYEGLMRIGASASAAVREGWGVLLRPDGTRFEGIWQADTLAFGIRTDSLGRYRGYFSNKLEAEGQGALWRNDGEYYQGEWKDGRREGHGFALKGNTLLRCGRWDNGRFKGERMVYTPDRVYGIDISRYQHEIGRKRYAIDWKKLRITGLGPGRRVEGKVDYPVSFIYIKATEGRSVVNRYYAADARQARRHGIATGSYHFFAPGSTGEEQAKFFLKKATGLRSDLPPVLDLEPTEKQIAQMGGEAKMFREVMVWMRRVEQACGRKPVLYVGQQFVNNHLVNAPAALRSHDVWVARYGAYKPYVRLLHWQLTPYGRVNGIKGEVDINVFNGTRQQFEEYLKKVDVK